MNRPSFVNQEKPFIVCVLSDKDPNSTLATIRNAECDGANAFDLHLRCLERQYLNKTDLSNIIMSSYKPMMMIFYRKGPLAWTQNISDEDREEAFMLSLECGASACDVMADFYDPSYDEISRKPEIITRQRNLIENIHKKGGEVIMSSHTWREMSCDEVVSHMVELEKRDADMVKIATVANSEAQLIESMKTTIALKSELKVPFIHIVMGQYGKMHRFVGPMLGSSLVFCVQNYTPEGHKEQPLVRSAKAVFENLDWHVARNPLSITR